MLALEIGERHAVRTLAVSGAAAAVALGERRRIGRHSAASGAQAKLGSAITGVIFTKFGRVPTTWSSRIAAQANARAGILAPDPVL
jgi:hypothetical protein